jgi:hypothetical protein
MRRPSRSPAYRQNLYREREAVIQAEPELTRGQVMALLRIRKGGDDSLFGKVLGALLATGSPDSGQMDRAFLIAEGYIQFDAKLRDFVLLPRGLFKAQQIARELAKTLDVHHIEFRSAAPRSNHGPTVACSCGWNTHASRTNQNTLRAFAARHLEKVEAGTYKPLGDIVDKIVAQLVSDSGSAKQYRVSGFVADLKSPGADARSVSASAPGDSSTQTNLGSGP